MLVILANGAKTTYGYDAILRLKEFTNTTAPSLRDSKNRGNPDQNNINKLSFSYDATSNILSNGHAVYLYDSLNRLTQAGYEPMQDKKNTTESFIYDPMGNRLTSLITQTRENEKERSEKDDKTKTDTTSYTSNILNQYTGVDKSKLTYDKNGNLTNNGKFQFVYDYRNRLMEVRKMGNQNDDKHSKNKTIRTKLIAEFKYDVLGRRLAKTIYEDENEIKKTIKYTYWNNDAIEENEYRYDDGKEKLKNVKEYIYWKGIDDVIVIISSEVEKFKLKNTKTYFYQKDQLGSITAITDKDGKIIEEYRYNAFGKAYIRDGKSDNWREFKESRIGNTRLFTGREYDREIGLYYYRARYYSAELGRFISRDPIGMSDDVNLYSYVGNNPVGFVDPMGLEKALFIRNNEGNAWYIDSSSFWDPWHAMLYFITGSTEYLVSFYPQGSNPESSGNNDIFFSFQPWEYHEDSTYIDSARGFIAQNSTSWYSITYIDKQYINTDNIAQWYVDTRSLTEPIQYNTFLNNCSTQVEDALVAGWFFQTNNWGIESPGALTISIQAEIFRRGIFQ